MNITLSSWQLATVAAAPAIALFMSKKLWEDQSQEHFVKTTPEEEEEEQEPNLDAQKKPTLLKVPRFDLPLNEHVCFIANGVITAMEDKKCVIDFINGFDKTIIEHILKEKSICLGTTIKYLGYKPKGVKVSHAVIKVITIESEQWDENIEDAMVKELAAKNKKLLEQIPIQEKELKCKVVADFGGRKIILSNGEHRYKVRLANKYDVPHVGDNVDITALFPLNENYLEELLEVLSIKKAKEELPEVLSIKKAKEEKKASVKYKIKEEFWVSIECILVPPFKQDVTTQIVQVCVTNRRSEGLTLMNIVLIDPETNKKHLFIKLHKPELYTDGFRLEGNAYHFLELQIQKEAENNDKLQLELTFDRFKLIRNINLIAKTKGSGSSNARLRYARPNLSELNKRRFAPVKMQGFEVPEELFTEFLKKNTFNELNDFLHIKYMFLNENLNIKNYKSWFELLLHLEEMQLYKGFRNYDCTEAHFLKEGEYLVLLIENLLERRPSLCVGDTVQILKGKTPDGSIQKVLADRIHIKFNAQFHANYNDEAYDLKFNFSRMSYRKLHHAIHTVSRRESKHLFPTKLAPREQPQLEANLKNEQLLIDNKNVEWFNQALNMNQKRAVCNVLKGEMDMPYCIFGAPGTGKTVTVVETILQLRQHLPKSFILVAASSNSAANIIAMRLLKCKPGLKLLRLISYSQLDREMLPPELLQYSALLDNCAHEGMSRNSAGVLLHCTPEYISKHNLLIGTCVTLGNLMITQFSVNHFTHAIVDEAAQCNEPELMCVASLLGSSGQLILAGDPQQLSPLAMNFVGRQLGMGTSYMERILDLSTYEKNKQVFPKTEGYDPRLVTMLTYNYRSLPSILKFYNCLFYDGDLKPVLKNNSAVELTFLDAGKKAIKEQNADVKDLPKYIGTYFCALKSVNMKAPDSPSWYNEIEAKHVYCTALAIIAQGIPVEDIGIISPYIKQVRFLRNLFQIEDDAAIPKIGTIEEFQGQERAIILISTVRTKELHINEDRRQGLGFLSAPSRLNVAISRARALVIVFGNPILLKNDDHWLTYIQYCYHNKTCYGDAKLLTDLKKIMDDQN